MVQQLTVLIVDNHFEDCQRYESYLRQNSECRYTILSESTGNAGLDLYNTLHPDLILLEYLLPDMDGLEFLAKLKQTQKQHKEIPPVIMITGHGNENVAVRAIKSGFQDYLVKEQVTAELLNNTINSAVESVILSFQEVGKHWCCSEERFRTSVENMLDCFGIFSSIRDEAGNIVDFRIDYMNAAACECNQMTKEQQLGKQLCEVFPSHRTTGLFEEYCQVVKTNKPLVKESLIYTDIFDKQELTRAFDIRAAKLGDGFVVSWRDVTENKLAKERLQSSEKLLERITDTTPGLVYVYDLVEQQSVYTNNQIGKLLGYSTREIQEMGSNAISYLMHPDDLAKLPTLYQRFETADDGNILETEYRLRHANGSWHWFYSWDTVFTRNPDGSPRQLIGTALDITNSKQIQEELRLSNKRFQLASRAVDSVIYDWDITINSIIRTEGITNILGYSLEEIEPTIEWWMRLVHPEDKNNLFQPLQAVLANQEYYTFEYRVRHKNGQYCYVLDRGSVVRNAQFRPVRVVGSITDITKPKQAETALCESEAKFRRIIESNIVGIYFGDFTGRIYEANDAFLQTFGYSREELENGCLYWNRMTPQEYFELDEQKIQELQTDGACKPFEKEYLAKDGTRIPILLAITTVESREIEGYSVCFVLDITKRKQAQLKLRESEQQYRFLSESIPQIVWSCNPQGEWEYISRRWVEYTGKSIEEAKNFGWLNVLHPEDAVGVKDIWQQSLTSGELYSSEMRYRRSDGIYRWFLVRALPIKDEQGEVLKWFGTSTDIHERKQLEAITSEILQREQTARTEAETANKAKDEFVAMVSHDLRSPLNSILGWAKLLRTRNLDQTATTRALETIERNALSQAKLLEDLLDTSRILQGTIQLDITRINLVKTVEAAIETAHPVADVKSIHIESTIDNSLPLIQGDSNRLQQVLGNLLSNAIKFTPKEGRVWVELSFEKIGRGTIVLGGFPDLKQAPWEEGELTFSTSPDLNFCRYVRIAVSDTGIGISPDFLPYVFERYRQAEGNKKKGGLGLGLAISRHIVELHGGTIEVFSGGEGKGSTFTIKLPI